MNDPSHNALKSRVDAYLKTLYDKNILTELLIRDLWRRIEVLETSVDYLNSVLDKMKETK